MKRKDCAYCIDLDEQGALCDHPLRWDCGEPVEARCSTRCADYERRISVTEALSRIHDLEAKLAESEKYRARYADMLIPIMAENAKLRELVREIWRSCPVGEDDCAKCPHHIEESDEDWCDILILMEKLGVEVEG